MKKYLLLFSALFLILTGCSQDKEEPTEEVTETEVDGDIEEETEEVEQEQMYVELMSYSFNKEDGTINIKVKTDDIPDGTVVSGRATTGRTKDENPDFIFVGDSKIKNGKANINIKPDDSDDEDVIYPSTIIPNGLYDLSLIVRVNQDLELNLHLLDSWGDYDEFNNKYLFNGTLREDEDGDYLALFQFEDTIDVSEAISAEEANSIDNEIQEEKEKAEEEERLKENKEEYEDLDFKQLDKNPDKHSGELVKYSGKIVQIIEGENSSDIRLGLGEYGGDIIYIYFDDVTDFVKDDQITVYGEVEGSYTYDTTIGGQMTVPLILADIIE